MKAIKAIKTIVKRRRANISRWSDFSPKAYFISFVEFVKFRCLLIHYINFVPRALPLEIDSPKFVSEKNGNEVRWFVEL